MRFAAVAMTILLWALTGCAGDTGDESAEGVMGDAVILDVRTPEEFGDGHLVGARNLSLQADDFDEQIAALPTDAEYVVYCRTGNRSAEAATRMRDLGLSVEDLGSLEDAAAATGIDVVDRDS